MTLPSISLCPGCGNTKLRQVQYPDGSVWLCDRCRLQWARVDKSARGGFIPTTNEHYHAPASLGEPYAYQPYVDFFTELKAQRGQGPQRILDIGCGSGAFVMHCLDCGHDAWGVEADTKLGRFMSTAVEARVHFGLAEDFAVQDEPYDVITFWDSFEHMEQSFELLDRLRVHLKPNGLVYLRVNNNWDIFNLLTLLALRLAPGFGKKMLRACFNYPDHCWNFSRMAMTSMLEQRGWKTLVVHIGETPATRLSSNPLFRFAIRCAYMMNALIGGGKIGNYYLTQAK